MTPTLEWSTWREAVSVIRFWPNLKATLSAAVVVGTVLFAINQLDIVIQHRATAATWVKTGFTYLVPLCVANYGLLVATRRRRGMHR